ncbi:MAG: C25 family cysteine peptidase, partial [candidate division Zixibacteria bacterium]|nr:C25 family cysteine peptidase [candidate division Zixibacteria bacterium]
MSRFVLLGVSLTTLLIAPTIVADRIDQDYRFAAPQIETLTYNVVTFDRVTVAGAPSGGQIGEPSLPVGAARILLPNGHKLDSVVVVAENPRRLRSNDRVLPVMAPVPYSLVATRSSPPRPDAKIYASDNPFPVRRHTAVGTYLFRGYRILVLKLHPVTYRPLSGELTGYTQLTVSVFTSPGNADTEMLRGLSTDTEEVLRRVDNSEALASYQAASKGGDRSYDLLILTTPSLAAAFQPLKDFHDSTGIPTEIHTIADIGSNDPDDVRDYIRERYLADGIQYVLIGADDDVIPAKDLFVQSWVGIIHGDPPWYEFAMPADVYFGCLDGTYNYDGDQYWGEPTDGDGGGDVDLMAEVYIGRATVDNNTDVGHVVHKTIAYLTNQQPYLDRVLTVGERLGYGGDVEFAQPYVDELIDSSFHHGYFTHGIPTDAYTVERLYDYDYQPNGWELWRLVQKIENGRHMIHHLGHCNYQIVLKMYSYQVASLTNNGLFFLYSQGCHGGEFDHVTDCWAEYATAGTDYAAFASIQNARYGWGTSRTTWGTTDAPNQRFHREF